MTTRKHFRAMAAAIAKIEDKKERAIQANLAADMFAKDNPRFNRALFLAACNVPA